MTQEQEQAKVRAAVLHALNVHASANDPRVERIAAYCTVKHRREMNWDSDTGDRIPVDVPYVAVVHQDGGICEHRDGRPLTVPELVQEIVDARQHDGTWLRWQRVPGR